MRVILDVSAVPARPAGAGVYICALASGLAAQADVELHLATRRGDGERWSTLAPGAAIHPVAPDSRARRIAWEQAGARKLAARVAPDVWHGPHYTMPWRLGVPAVVTVHDLTFFDHPEWHERTKVPFFRQMIRTSARHAAAIVCVSEYTAKRLRAVAPPHGPITVAPHGVDHNRFSPDGDEVDDLARLATHGVTPPYVAFGPATLEPRKGIPTLLAAFARVAPRHPDLRLALVGGDGWGVSEVRDAIAASGVATHVVRTGYIDHDVVPALYRRAAVVAYPSLEEGFGLPALEALAAGAPLVTTTGSAPEEIVGRAALTVPPGDGDALAAALRTLLEDGSRAAALRRAGPEQARPFTWARSVERHVVTYRELIA
jgi:glycosyltransferase involved in cell wall biosynthesis